MFIRRFSSERKIETFQNYRDYGSYGILKFTVQVADVFSHGSQTSVQTTESFVDHNKNRILYEINRFGVLSFSSWDLKLGYPKSDRKL